MAELLLFGSVGFSWWGEDSFTSASVNAWLADQAGDITVRINSGGGDAVEGQAIHAALVRYSGKVTVVVEGCAASAASLIAMAGDEIVMTLGSWMLIHDPATPCTEGRGTPDDHARLAQHLDLIADGYAAIYAERSGNTAAACRVLMQGDTLLTADTAVQMGFATRIDTTEAAQPVAAFDYRIYANAPQIARDAADRNLGAFKGKQAVLAMMMETKMNVRANTPNPANPEPKAPAAIKMSAAAVSRVYIAAATAGMKTEEAAKIVEMSKTETEAMDTVTDWWKAQGGDDPPSIGEPTARVGRDFTSPRELATRQADAVAAKLATRMGLKHEPTLGREFMSDSLLDMKGAQLAAIGHRTRGNAEVIQMLGSHTADDFPLVIGGGLTAVVRRMMDQAEVAISRCARTVESEDYRTGNAVGLTGTGVPEKVNEAGEIKFTSINEEGEVKAVPDDYGQIFRLTKKALVNDSTALGQLEDISRLMIKGAMELKRQTLLAPLLANTRAGQTMRDSVALFNSAHGNVAGSGAVLSLTTLSAGRTAMRRQKDSKGTILNIEPRILLVPPELETVAQQVVAQITAAKTSDANPFADQLEVVTEAGLTSATDWYLAADPSMVDGLVMAYLTGQEAPQIDAKDGWGTLGMEFRLVWAIGAAFHGYQGWYRNPGA